MSRQSERTEAVQKASAGKPGRNRPVFFQGRTYPVQGRERIRGRLYLLLEQLAPPPRARWLVFDSAARALRTMLILPAGESTAQHLEVLRQIEHNCLPRILDSDLGKTQARIVLPWIQGIDLGEYLKRIAKQKVDPPEPFHAIRLILELARGLCSLHRNAQVIHGDIKPANLILTRKSSHLHLIDFGSGWPMGMTGVRCPADGISAIYAAPELSAGNVINEWVDQFSASVVLYQLLTGQIPYEGLGGKAGWPEWREEGHVARPPSSQPLSRKPLPKSIWREIDALVLKGIDLDPNRRFPHSPAWVDAIESVYLKLRIRRDPHRRRETWWDRIFGWMVDRLDSQSP